MIAKNASQLSHQDPGATYRKKRPDPNEAEGASHLRQSSGDKGNDSVLITRRMPRRSRRGLVGTLLSIVVGVAIIIGIFSVYNQVTATATAANTSIFIRQLTPQIMARYKGSYVGINAEKMIQAGFVPTTWQKAEDSIEDPRGNNVTIAPGTGNNSFVITFEGGVLEEACEAVLNATLDDTTLSAVQIRKATVAFAARDTVNDIATACNDADADDFVLEFDR